MRATEERRSILLTVTLFCVLALTVPGANARPSGLARSERLTTEAGPAFASTVFAKGSTLTHQTPQGRQQLSLPDDITALDNHLFVGFQNGVGPQGQPSSTGTKDSTVVEFDLRRHAVAQWDIAGKCDGLAADSATGRVIATVNEDAHSSLYLIDPRAGTSPLHYRYGSSLPSHGGTDAISVYDGMVLISASAPGTTGKAAPQSTYPAVYRAVLNAATHVATLQALFSDEASALVANTTGVKHGASLRLALTDPDSNEVVPAYAERFAGDFMLTSQGDKEQVFVAAAGTSRQSLSVLRLSASVDDTAWPSGSSGAIYATDNGADVIDRITGPFSKGSVFVAVTPCDAIGAPNTCPGPGYPPNHLGELDPRTGVVTSVDVRGPVVATQGMLFLP